jgi:TPR repeat protein
MRRLAAALAALAMTNPSLASVDEGIAAYNAGRHEAARQHFEQAAAAGSPAGKHLLASLYYQGHGVPKDLARAVALFTEAADAGFPPSMANLALMYSLGDGVPKNQEKALAYALRAAESGDVQSQFNLAQSYRRGAGVPRDDSKAALW